MDILTLREERDKKEEDLLKTYGGALLTIRPNYPGEDKRHPLCTFAVKTMDKEVKKAFSPLFSDASHTKEGYIIHLVFDTDPLKIKNFCVSLEETHPLGRLLDMDVRTKDRMLSRGEMGLPLRKCYLCDAHALHCVRERRHNMEDVRNHFHLTVERFLK